MYLNRITIIAAVLALPAKSMAGHMCQDGDLWCDVSFSTQVEQETGNYPVWTDCGIGDETQWTADGELEEIPGTDVLERICQSSLTLFFENVQEEETDTDDQPLSANCSNTDGTCHVAVYAEADAETGKYPWGGDCVFGEETEIALDGDIDHLPTEEELMDMCNQCLASNQENSDDASEESGASKDGTDAEAGQNASGDGCSVITLGKGHSMRHYLTILFSLFTN